MHDDTYVMHVSWYMSGSLTRGRGKTLPTFPAHAQTAILRIWREARDQTPHRETSSRPSCVYYGSEWLLQEWLQWTMKENWGYQSISFSFISARIILIFFPDHRQCITWSLTFGIFFWYCSLLHFSLVSYTMLQICIIIVWGGHCPFGHMKQCCNTNVLWLFDHALHCVYYVWGVVKN